MKKFIVIFVVALLAVSCAGNRTKAKGDMDTETWVVGSEMVNCMGVGPQRCLIIKPEGQTEWQFHYSGIEGFDYEPGYEYTLSVYKERVENPPMDASSIRYVLDRVLSKERKTSEDIPDSSHIFQ